MQSTKEKTYRENFPWVDQITEVKSKVKQLELDEKLINCIADRRFERCWLAAPDIIDRNVVWVSATVFPGCASACSSASRSWAGFLGRQTDASRGEHGGMG